MKLTTEQQSAVRSWVAAGASLSEVQTRLASDFKVEMTYLDVRLLVLDLGATLKDKPAPKPAAKPSAAPAGAEAPAPEPPPAAGPLANPPPAAGSLSVTVDTIVVPGAVASGTVRFSDGVTAKWVFDQMGRLGLEDTSKPGYRPSPADVSAFQQELAKALQSRGMI